MKYFIAYDLGTGGIKTSLFDEKGNSVASAFEECDTIYPENDFREQRPQDWWNILKSTTKKLMSKTNIAIDDILGAGCSGHSLGVVPIDENGNLLINSVPIWSDARASKQENDVFQKLNYNDWYMKTGNGFPAKLYGGFKILWYKENMPELYEKTAVFIGTKDYLNYKLTGVLATDHSYASGSGVYDLNVCDYSDELIDGVGIDKSKLPKIFESHEVIGTINADVAKELGLSQKMQISAGGVDNACMAAGAGCVEDGMAYTSLGTSSWVAVTGSKPIVNTVSLPYVFAHLIKGKYASATCIFSAGNTFRWVRDVICNDLVQIEENGGENSYVAMDRLAGKSPIGANGLFMVPHLAGGNGLDKSVNVRGAFTGLDLKHTKGDLIRATLEGICFGLKVALDELEKEVELQEDMLIVGGGAKSEYWMSLFADIYDMNINNTAVGENAGSLGAMATIAIGTGVWKDYSPLKEINKPTKHYKKTVENVELYEKLYNKYKVISNFQSEIAEI